MTAKAVKVAFSELVAATPAPPTMQSIADNFQARIKNSRREILRWRTAFLVHLARLQDLLDESVEEIGIETTSEIAVKPLAEMREQLEEVVRAAIDSAKLDPKVDAGLNEVASKSADAAKMTKWARKEFYRSADLLVGLATDMRDRVLELELEFDVDSHANDESPRFTSADDLIAHLKSL